MTACSCFFLYLTLSPHRCFWNQFFFNAERQTMTKILFSATANFLKKRGAGFCEPACGATGCEVHQDEDVTLYLTSQVQKRLMTF